MSIRNYSILFLAALIFFSGLGGLYAAPLEGGFASAPSASASKEEKNAAYGKARSKVIAAARTYERTPYRYGGLDKRGLDCSGFIFVSFRDALGVSVPRSAQNIYSWTEKCTIDKANPGDLLFFRTTGGASISHVAIYLGDRRFIHAASEGPSTGVIYSNLDEKYWARTYAGAGRALPAAAVDNQSIDNGGGSGSDNSGGNDTENNKAPKSKKEEKKPKKGQNYSILGFAVAPTWNTHSGTNGIFRGAAGQFRIGASVTLFDRPMIVGLELRPEWDGALGVYRMPLTLAWGPSDKFLIFAGPAFSFGDAVLNVNGEDREYIGGTNWFGAAGITVAPIKFTISGNELAPYGEIAWQSYVSSNSDINIGADLAASFRISTGLRYTWKRF